MGAPLTAPLPTRPKGAKTRTASTSEWRENGAQVTHREADDDLKLVQQKSRWTIARKYVGRSIWIAFRDRGEWFLAPHDELVGLGATAGYTATSSWTEKGIYHMAAMSRDLREQCEKY